MSTEEAVKVKTVPALVSGHTETSPGKASAQSWTFETQSMIDSTRRVGAVRGTVPDGRPIPPYSFVTLTSNRKHFAGHFPRPEAFANGQHMAPHRMAYPHPAWLRNLW